MKSTEKYYIKNIYRPNLSHNISNKIMILFNMDYRNQYQIFF